MYINGTIAISSAILYKIRHLFSKTLRLKLYNTFILPYLNYCNSVWGSTYPTNLKIITVSQKRTLGLALNVWRETPSNNNNKNNNN